MMMRQNTLLLLWARSNVYIIRPCLLMGRSRLSMSDLEPDNVLFSSARVYYPGLQHTHVHMRHLGWKGGRGTLITYYIGLLRGRCVGGGGKGQLRWLGLSFFNFGFLILRRMDGMGKCSLSLNSRHYWHYIVVLCVCTDAIYLCRTTQRC